MKFKKYHFVLITISLIVLSSCVKVVPVEECISGDLYGFWHGLLHGIILPFQFIVSLFNDEIAIYAINNNGGWYDFGFVFGASIILGGGTKASCKKRS